MKPKRSLVTVPRSISARMIDRYIFNFRLRPDRLARYLPVNWLEPQVINGWSVVSFCILVLDKITVFPLPSILPFKTISCAYRIGVVDQSGENPGPSVYITDRLSNLSIIARLAPFLLLDTIPMVNIAIARADQTTDLQLSYPSGKYLFSAKVNPSEDAERLDSEVFDRVEAFAGFIKSGVSSYTPSIYGDLYARVDLHKEDLRYQPLDVDLYYSELNDIWRDAGLIFDSAVHASGALYKWTYRGLYQGWAQPAPAILEPA